MLRSWLVLLLLANYLLVVGAGLVNRPQPPRYSAAHPYIHSPDCQQKHYLLVDCFDQCNGTQDVVQKRTATENAAHLLSIIKGIDVHCLTEAVVIEPAYGRSASTTFTPDTPALHAGFQVDFYPPPRRG